MILFFDTETNGKPISATASPTEIDNWPRITQLAWMLCSEKGLIVDSSSSFVKPDGWVIPEEEFFIKNGHTTARNEASGIPAKIVLTKFAGAIDRCHTMVAHNMAFDYPVTVAEMIRYGVRANNKPNKFCTMASSVNIVKKPNLKGNGYKWPSLMELYTHCFGAPFDGAHDAFSDLTATAKCYYRLWHQIDF